MEQNAKLIGSIARIRLNKLVKLGALCAICSVVFVFYVTKLAMVIFPKAATAGSRTLPQANVQDAVYDDEERDEAEVNDEDLDEANLGKRLASGIDAVVGKYDDYNADAKRVSTLYDGSDTLFKEVRRDHKMLSSNDDDWGQVLDAEAERPATFTTYNTLTDQ